MSTYACDSKPFEAAAFLSLHEAGKIEVALLESARLDAAARAEEAALDDLRGRLAGLADGVVEGFEEFSAWRDRCERKWSAEPAAYSRTAHLELRAITATWFDIHSRTVKLLDWFERSGAELPKAKIVRERYSIMLSVEMMDSGPMPEHIKELALRAIRA